MRLPHYLTCLALVLMLSTLSAGNRAYAQEKCPDVDAKIQIRATGAGKHTVTVEITKGNKSRAKYLFCKKEGNLLNEQTLKQNSIENLPAGEYFCVIVGAGHDCSKKISFTIE